MAQLQFRAVAQHYHVFAVEALAEFADGIEVDNGGAMDATEASRIQPQL